MKGKLKINLDAQALQDLAQRHVEKAVFAVVAVVFVLFAYGAAKREKLAWGPQRLDQEARLADDHLLRTDVSKLPRHYTEWDKAQPGITLPGNYPVPTPPGPPVFDDILKRKSPQLLAMKDLRTFAGHGAVQTEAAAQRGVEGRRWVGVTAVVDNEAQYYSFKKTYAGCYEDPERPGQNRPRYAGYQVQRAEVVRGTPQNWETLVLDEHFGLMARESSRLDRVDPKYLYTCSRVNESGEGQDPQEVQFSLAQPLPLAYGHAWGPEVGHLPEIPVVEEDDRMRGGPPPRPGAATEPVEENLIRDPDLEHAAAEGEGFRGRDGLPSIGPPGGLLGGRRAAPVMHGGRGAAGDQQLRRFLLFRFFDFSVEPGKRYCYRVRLELDNPNYGTSPQWLINEKDNKERYLASPWSERSDVAAVPPDLRVLVAATSPECPPDKCPVTLMLLRFDIETGAETGLVCPNWDDEPPVPLARGKLLNVTDPKSAVEYNTETVLLDFVGGRRPDRNSPPEPVSVLLLNPDGSLSVRHELADRAEVARNHDREGRGGPDPRLIPPGRGGAGLDPRLIVPKRSPDPDRRLPPRRGDLLEAPDARRTRGPR